MPAILVLDKVIREIVEALEKVGKAFESLDQSEPKISNSSIYSDRRFGEWRRGTANLKPIIMREGRRIWMRK